MGFERCHPAVNLIFFAAVISGTAAFRHPVFLCVSLVCSFAYSIWRNRGRAVLLILFLLLCASGYALYYSSFHHFGVTVLQQNFVGNNMTVESLVYGLVLGLAIAGVCIWMSCVYTIFSTDKMVFLFGSISPRLSLFLAILLRMVPRIQREARKIHMAQRGIGRGIGQGNLWQRLRNFLSIVSILITWTLDSLIAASEAMRCRGSALRGRTAFPQYRFDNRDRAFVIGMFTMISMTLTAWLVGATDLVYAPRILWEPVNTGDLCFYSGYAALCLMPLGLEVYTEYAFARARSGIL